MTEKERLKVKKKWVRFPQEKMAINVINDKIVVDEDDFMVWGLGKNTGFGTTYADIVKRETGYEIGIGKKGIGGKGWWKEKHKRREDALKSLIKEMKKRGKINY